MAIPVALPPAIIFPSIIIISPSFIAAVVPSLMMINPAVVTLVPFDMVRSDAIGPAGLPIFIIIILPCAIMTPSMSPAIAIGWPPNTATKMAKTTTVVVQVLMWIMDPLMSDSIRLRICTPADCAAVLRLWLDADATPSVTDTIGEVQRVIDEGVAIFLVATDANDRVVGSVIGGWDGWRGNIYRLAVAPEARRHRVAAALVREVSARLAREKGARRITALVEKAHPDAVAFWDSMTSDGYEFDARIIRYIKTIEP